MDLKGSLVDTHLRIYPSEYLTTFLKTLPDTENIPINILKLIGRNCKGSLNKDIENIKKVHLTNEDLMNIKDISHFVAANTPSEPDEIETDIVSKENDKLNEKKICDENKTCNKEETCDKEKTCNKEKTCDKKETCDEKEKFGDTPEKQSCKETEEKEHVETKEPAEDMAPKKNNSPFLTTSDIDWLYSHIQKRKTNGENIPYLHTLLEGSNIKMPDNKIMKRNPELEARCVKLRAEEEARVYRQMTKGVDNVRMRFPEDSISYQMKQLNRHLIAIGQFLLSIFAGFLFGFRGIEWIVGNLDFGFRLLLGVMCALVIALAEIYFLAKKLNEELSVPETVQLGGPPKYKHLPTPMVGKEHQD